MSIDPTTRSWLRNESDERAVVNGCRFDVLRGAWTVYWIERYCRLYEGEEYAGKPLILSGCKECDHSRLYAVEGWDDPSAPPPLEVLERAERFAECVAAGHRIGWQYECFMRLFSWVRMSEKWNREVRRFRQSSIWIPKKQGKALALDTSLPTPDGWTTIGELKVGDRLFSEDGTQCTVVQLHPIIEDGDSYLVTFSNGEQVRCNGDHLWKTTVLQRSIVGATGKVFAGNQWTGKLNNRFSPTAIRSTREIVKSLLRGDGARNHSVSMPLPIETAEKELPIHPYVFGAWLGDGDSDGARLTCSKDDYTHWKTEFNRCGVLLRERQDKPESNACRAQIGVKRGNFRTTLRAIGLFRNKHIPIDYLRASRGQRIALLQGLMDMDGCADKPGKSLTFVTTKRVLRDGVCELLASLGIKFRMREQRAKIKGVDKGPCWWIQFHAFRDDLEVFRLPRKLERQRWRSDLTMSKPRSRTVQIVVAEKTQPVPMRCITVSAPSGMFLCGRTMLPTHNSPSLAALGLYLLAGDGERGQKVFLAAKDGEQARTNAGKHAVEMYLQSAELKAVCSLNRNILQIAHEPSRSIMRPLSSSNSRTQESKEGLNGSILIDETHVVDRAFVDRISRAGISRSEPLFCEFSTAGNNPDSYGKERFDKAADVLAGRITDEELFAAVYAAPQDVTDEQLEADIDGIAAKCNPEWGDLIDPHELRRDYERSKAKIENLANFKMYRLNVWQHSSNPWLRASDWAACAGEYTEADLKGLTCFGGLDLSLRWDLSAFVLLFPWGADAPAGFRVWPYFFLPKDSARKTKDRVSWQDWAARGFLTLTDGDTTDFPLIRRVITEAKDKFDLQNVAYDDRFAEILAQELQDEDGLTMVDFNQTPQNFAEPMGLFEADVISRRLEHPNNACLNWQAGNATKNKKGMLVKPEADDVKKIDGITAAVMARWMMAAHVESYWNPADGVTV